MKTDIEQIIEKLERKSKWLLKNSGSRVISVSLSDIKTLLQHLKGYCDTCECCIKHEDYIRSGSSICGWFKSKLHNKPIDNTTSCIHHKEKGTK